ncbi:MAG TPA: hypothetical protein VG144_07930 [Gaiellaceae bacterium]|nr:hypothetical protein [Gaiellaceae bacterium]
MRLLVAELLKVRTAPRTAVGLTLGLLALVGLGAAATASEAGGDDRGATVGWDLLEVVSIAAIFTLIFGILVVTWEYRHGTITQTYLATPKRERVVGVKLVVAFMLGATLAAVAIAVVLVVARFWLSYELEQGHWELAGRTVLGAALWGVLGAGLGALLQSQIGAIISAFVWFLVAEPLLGFTLGELTDSSIGDYFPGGALDRLQETSQGVEIGSEEFLGEAEPYGLWAAAVLASAYAAAFAGLGMASALWRDVP